jgi:hypothetical protein
MKKGKTAGREIMSKLRMSIDFLLRKKRPGPHQLMRGEKKREKKNKKSQHANNFCSQSGVQEGLRVASEIGDKITSVESTGITWPDMDVITKEITYHRSIQRFCRHPDICHIKRPKIRGLVDYAAP